MKHLVRKPSPYTKEEANKIVVNMLSKEGESQAAGVGNSFLTTRKFEKIKDDNKYSGALDNMFGGNPLDDFPSIDKRPPTDKFTEPMS